MANLIVAQLLFLESENPDKDIHLYINSPGGSVTAGLSIYDTMQFIKPDVSTMCIGQAASWALFCLRWRSGKRYLSAQCTHHDSSAQWRRPGAGHRYRYPGQGNSYYSRAPERLDGRAHRAALEVIERDTERDRFMDAEQSKDYGLVDRGGRSRKRPRIRCRIRISPLGLAKSRKTSS